ncbi:hypothetical protein Micbo1qcDRAFT_61826 [Microdochium bolleyi]|uniref:Uncharacterized protein n=1 Tax=Microdochium bolleyi TaxID=196109 RepID=A0A136J5J8_9PEZI|nr:hypothetical protein Micbo1qcDRAFT_61826 [Microdochium bolleyi]
MDHAMRDSGGAPRSRQAWKAWLVFLCKAAIVLVPAVSFQSQYLIPWHFTQSGSSHYSAPLGYCR